LTGLIDQWAPDRCNRYLFPCFGRNLWDGRTG